MAFNGRGCASPTRKVNYETRRRSHLPHRPVRVHPPLTRSRTRGSELHTTSQHSTSRTTGTPPKHRRAARPASAVIATRIDCAAVSSGLRTSGVAMEGGVHAGCRVESAIVLSSRMGRDRAPCAAPERNHHAKSSEKRSRALSRARKRARKVKPYLWVAEGSRARERPRRRESGGSARTGSPRARSEPASAP